jgi:hypothetical protein
MLRASQAAQPHDQPPTGDRSEVPLAVGVPVLIQQVVDSDVPRELLTQGKLLLHPQVPEDHAGRPEALAAVDEALALPTRRRVHRKTDDRYGHFDRPSQGVYRNVG